MVTDIFHSVGLTDSASDLYLRERDVPCLIYQGRLNMLDKEPMESGILELCREHGVGFISFSPLA
jgi:L-glyceraldehyde 3-phosphate reductase